MYTKYLAIKEIIQNYIDIYGCEPEILFINNLEFKEICNLPEIGVKTTSGNWTFDQRLDYILIDEDIEPAVFRHKDLREIIDKRLVEDRLDDDKDEKVTLKIFNKYTQQSAGTKFHFIPALFIKTYRETFIN
ncbi:hypothetical protein [Acinetobacter pittii]|uniref:hypothetical protein n=1 Tax=Acinetobacter pittii TaxID=48296 RepID=UPI00238005CE|nr:hypothetical protein [Acinetobacter pittii]MDE4040723.1 hypothetical protein [Acinetobacter pittii]